jgi:D-beta-D-heptose 7-phosphate kinase/D-beta-D-heptose 1-phosphate adenosyltransferase
LTGRTINVQDAYRIPRDRPYRFDRAFDERNNYLTVSVFLVPILDRARAQKKRIVFTNGCFDLMHVGHTRYLQAARQLGDLLVVGVNSDASVRSLNKSPDRPIVGEAQRAEVLAALGCVDYVVIFTEPDPLNLITTLQPDVLVKGGDWAIDRIVGRDVVEQRGGTVKTIPLVPGMSTTGLIQRIRSQQP